MRLIGALMVLVGCNVGSLAAPDTPGGPEDGSPPGLGMFVNWSANPTLPGALTDKIDVSDATFQLDHFQIVADAGSVTRTKYLLAWDSNIKPPQDVFHDAPPGVYSKITLAMMEGNFGDYAYRIRGTWKDNGMTKPFEIRDDVQISLSFDCNATLAAAGSVTIAIKLDLTDALSGIDFGNVDEQDGVLKLNDLQLLGFRSRLQGAFSLAN